MTASVLLFTRSRATPPAPVVEPGRVLGLGAALFSAVVWLAAACVAVIAGAPVAPVVLLLPFGVSATTVALLVRRAAS
jgi:hypothetical protein